MIRITASAVFMVLLGAMKGSVKNVYWAQLSLVDSRGSTHRIENPRASGCGETPEFKGISKQIRVESGPQEEMSNSRGFQKAVFSPEVNSKTPNYKNTCE